MRLLFWQVSVSRDGPTDVDGYTWSVTFLTHGGDVPPLSVASLDDLSADGKRVSVEEASQGFLVNSVQTVTLVPGTGGAGGTFRLAFDGGTC